MALPTLVNAYVSLEEARAYIGITDEKDDVTLCNIINRSSRLVDGYCNRVFYKQTATARRFTPDDYCTLMVNDLVSLTSIVVDDTAWLTSEVQLYPFNAAADGRPYWRVDVDRKASKSFPVGLQASVVITGDWGWPDTSPHLEPVKAATLLTIHRLFKRISSPYGIAGTNEFGQVMMLQAKLDPDAQQLLAPFRNDMQVYSV